MTKLSVSESFANTVSPAVMLLWKPVHRTWLQCSRHTKTKTHLQQGGTSHSTDSRSNISVPLCSLCQTGLNSFSLPPTGRNQKAYTAIHQGDIHTICYRHWLRHWFPFDLVRSTLPLMTMFVYSGCWLMWSIQGNDSSSNNLSVISVKLMVLWESETGRY